MNLLLKETKIWSFIFERVANVVRLKMNQHVRHILYLGQCEIPVGR